MEHHEGSSLSYSSQQQQDEGAYAYGTPSHPARIRSSSPLVETANFRSQRITSPTHIGLGTAMGVPLLEPPSHELPATDKSSMAQEDSAPLSLAQKKQAFGTIPVFPSFHILERTAIQISEETVTVSHLLDRIFQYLKNHSIRYECEPDSGCFDCMSPNMIEFAVQLWQARVDDNNNDPTTTTTTKKIWVEVQRRQGCALAMNAIRRSLLRHIKGEPAFVAAPAAMAGSRRPCDETMESNLHSFCSNKRHKSISPQEARLNCQDALVVTVRLLESPRRDEQRLGLESLAVMTDPRLVSPVDATTVSRALILGEGPAGLRLQQRFASLLQEIQPTLNPSGLFGLCSFQGSTLAMMYHFILYTLATALGQLFRDNMAPRVDLKAPFWHTITMCLRVSLEDGMRRPHEATLAAKCLRFLLPSKTEETLHPPTLRSILTRSHEAGKAISLSLEEESRKTLSFL